MGRITTHILDTANGRPAAGVALRLYRLEPRREQVAATRSNADGRSDEALLTGNDMTTGSYELEFDIAEYFAASGTALSQPPFLGTVVIRFAVNADEHYHVPLLATPWSYSTYRGS